MALHLHGKAQNSVCRGTALISCKWGHFHIIFQRAFSIRGSGKSTTIISSPLPGCLCSYMYLDIDGQLEKSL
jgi:hypothetical protein